MHIQELCSEHCLRNVITVATRSPSKTCLDLLLVPVTLSCNAPSVIHLNDVTDHHLLTLNISFPSFSKPTAHNVYVRKPNPRALDKEMCCTHLREKLTEIPSAGNVNEKTRLLTQSLTKSMLPSLQACEYPVDLGCRHRSYQAFFTRLLLITSGGVELGTSWFTGKPAFHLPYALVHHEWVSEIGKGGTVNVLAIAITGAFDKVSHLGLLTKIQG